MKKNLTLVLIGAMSYLGYLKQDVIMEYWKLINQHPTPDIITEEVKTEPKKKPPLPPQPKKSLRFKKEFLIANNIPTSNTRSIKELCEYINNNTTTDLEKARTIYAWVALNIHYDDKGYNQSTYGDLSPESVLKSRKAVCSGYSNLYKTLCDSVGLQAVKITGYAKGYGYQVGDKMSDTDHAWNAVRVDGKWLLVDATWGAGYGNAVNGKLKSTQKFDDYWFATPPDEFIYKHLPENKKHQHLPHPISLSQYESLYAVNSDLFDLGFPSNRVYNFLIQSSNHKTPKAYSANINLKIKHAPISYYLSQENEFRIRIYSPENVSIAIINNDKWFYLTKKGAYFEGKIKPQTGELQIGYQLKSYDKNYNIILEYHVKKGIQEAV